MKVIHLDGTNWSKALDFFNALAEALQVIPGHGRGFDAFEDSVFYGGMSVVEPPFEIVVENCPAFAKHDVETMSQGWGEQRAWRKEHYGDDVEAIITLKS